MTPTSIELAQTLIRTDTRNPPGNEQKCGQPLIQLLSQAGFNIKEHVFAPGRSNIIATKSGERAGPALAFTGHLDTVPLGEKPWSVDPFGATISGNKLYGRGASDMKAAVAAFVTAAIEETASGKPHRDIVLVITAGEERGCEGALAMQDDGFTLPPIGGWIVAEPTVNQIALGHKGAVFAFMRFAGQTAHSSKPHLGDNAVYKACECALRLRDLQFNVRHPVLGSPTSNVGLIEGGHAPNAVPDRASLHVDVRTVPGMDHTAVLDLLKSRGGDQAVLEVVHDLPPVWTDEDDDFVAFCRSCCTVEGVNPGPAQGASFFTDAAVLLQFAPAPVVVVGPGQPDQAHVTDEWCSLEDIEAATRIYRRFIGSFGAS
ncbi:MAG: M20 family metallopeptidase [Rhodobacteraceae bacterium]|nr:M20 family metallopeptidase [Paracoccaceae bacterium]